MNSYLFGKNIGLFSKKFFRGCVVVFGGIKYNFSDGFFMGRVFVRRDINYFLDDFLDRICLSGGGLD